MRNNNLALGGLIACLTMSGVALVTTGCAGNQHQRSTGAYLDDKSISTRVKTALFRDSNVSGFDVKVNTFRGDVQLSGFVDTAEQKDRAAAIAREIPGVAMVTNNLEVKPAETAVGTSGAVVEQHSGTITQPVPDRPALDQPARTVAPVRTPDTDLNRTVTPNTYSAPLNSTTPSSTTLTPSSDLSNHSSLDTRTSPQNLHIDASNGKATLRGTVGSDIERQDIERRVRDIPGIMSIENELEVRAPASR